MYAKSIYCMRIDSQSTLFITSCLRNPPKFTLEVKLIVMHSIRNNYAKRAGVASI